MSDTTGRRRTMSTWRRLQAATRRLARRMAGVARRTLDNHSPELARAPIHSTGDRTMADDTTGDTMPATTGRQATREGTSVRHVRVGDAAWRDAATRARRDGRGIAEVVRALVTAYAAGALEAPNGGNGLDHGVALTESGGLGSGSASGQQTSRPADQAPPAPARLCDPPPDHTDPPRTYGDCA